jgi:quercetin dioxygenase-like cupin family protein
MEMTLAARWQDFLEYGEERPNPRTVLENERMRVIIAGLKAGQRIPAHPEAGAVYQFLEGQGTMTVDGQEFAIQPGTVIAMEQGAERGLQADTQLVFLAIRLA